MMSFRSSEHSVQSSTKSSSSNSEIAFGISETTTASRSNSSSEYQQMSQTQSSTQRHITSSNSNGSSSSSTTAIATATATATATTTATTATGISSEQLTSTSSMSAALQQTLGSNCSLPDLVPALPPKTQQRLAATSRFDAAMDELDDNFELPELRQLSPHHHQHHSTSTQLHQWHAKHHSLIEPPRSAQLPSSCSSAFDRHLDKPPPLPNKKKHILAYMDFCSANSHSVEQHRHTMHTYNISRNISHSQTLNIMPVSKDLSPELETPPALLPKNYKQRKPSTTTSTSTTVPTAIITTPPASPKATLGDPLLRNSRMTTVSEELNDVQGTSDETGVLATAVVDSNENVSTAGGQKFYCHSHQLPSESLATVSSSEPMVISLTSDSL